MFPVWRFHCSTDSRNKLYFGNRPLHNLTLVVAAETLDFNNRGRRTDRKSFGPEYLFNRKEIARAGLEDRRRSVNCRSERVVQHRQPLPSSATSSVVPRTTASSMPTAPNSLMTTAVLRPSSVVRKRRTRVVLPAPGKPVTTVTGKRAPRALLPAGPISFDLKGRIRSWNRKTFRYQWLA